MLSSNPFRLLLALAALAGSLTGCHSDAEPAQPHVVTIGQASWEVELATTPQQRYQGLSGRVKVAEGTGMLFVFPEAAMMEFCMRGCEVPLDIAFIGPDRKVVHVTTMQVEADRSGSVFYSSQKPAQWVLEVPAGELTRAGVQPGDAVSFSANIPPATQASP